MLFFFQTEIFEIMLRDFKEFDPIVWSYAVSVSLGVLITLSCTVCLMLLRDHCEELEIRKQLEGEFVDEFSIKNH